MGFDFRFRDVGSRSDLGRLVDFLASQSLDYPGYDDWVQRAEAEIYAGYKRAILAFSSGHLVGDLVFQQHKEMARVMELKNMRVHPAVRSRYFARFMIRQAETEGRDWSDAVICDVRTSQTATIRLMGSLGYAQVAAVPLYRKDEPEVVMAKVFDKRLESGILVRSKDFVVGKALV